MLGKIWPNLMQVAIAKKIHKVKNVSNNFNLAFVYLEFVSKVLKVKYNQFNVNGLAY
ncbi:MAG: hypothetical protein ACI8ZX_002902 [Planctomycetota bacterium]|jgi:hypothetical protein